MDCDYINMDCDDIKRVAIGAAYKGGEVIRSCFGKLVGVDRKGSIDLVTEADIGSERAIIESIRSRFPDHAILAEESGLRQGNEQFRWIIDPLDGTTNFAHQLSIVSVSIAFEMNGTLTVGVVLNPMTGELFCAILNKGAELNGRKIRVSDTKHVSDSLLVTGFPYDHHRIFSELIQRFSKCLKASQGVRRLGSAALDLCFVACGRFDGFWEQNLKPWDTAAGVLIAKEAGAIVTDFSNNPFTIEKKEILAANPFIHHELLSILKIEEGS